MTLRELLSHFINKTTWVDLYISSKKMSGEIKNIEKDVSDKILESKVSNWTFTNSLEINI